MKKKLSALILALLLIPAVLAHAAQTGFAESRMEGIYAVIGGGQSITISSHAELTGRGGYSQALFAVELTGDETKEELDAIAVGLLEDDVPPVWGGSKHCYHGGGYAADPSCTIRADDFAPGSYLYVCYTFDCQGGSYNHYLIPNFERISTMSLRITEQAQGLELTYALTDEDGVRLDGCENGGTLTLDLNGPAAFLRLLSEVQYPTEEILGLEASFDQEAPAFTLDPASLELKPLLCGSGSITVAIKPYLSDEVRTETIHISVPCAPMAEQTILVENTCTDDGLAAHLCHGYGVNCETVFDEVVLPARGHTLYSISQYIEKPTATLPGLGMGTCRDCGLIGVEQEVPPIFCDVAPDAFYSRALDYCYEKGWVSGMTENTFAPGDSCVRAYVVTFLWRAAGCPRADSRENPFADVKETDFFYDAVLWAVQEGITTGTDPNHFSPAGVCNRVQVVTFLWRAFGQPGTESTEHTFTDVQPGSWYEPAVLWALEEGVTSGLSATAFGPGVTCNRAQIVTFLYRAYAE